MKGHKAKEPYGKITLKYTGTETCPLPKCETCELEWAKGRNPDVAKQHANKEKRVFWHGTSTNLVILSHWFTILCGFQVNWRRNYDVNEQI